MRSALGFFFVFPTMPLFVKQHRTATERKDAVSPSPLGSLTSAPGMNIRGAAAEKTGCMGPCTQPACGAAWRTAMETRSVTGSGGIRHSCRHFPFWQPDEDINATPCTTTTTTGRKMWSDNVNCCVAQMFISKLVKHPGIFPNHTQGPWLPLPRAALSQEEKHW